MGDASNKMSNLTQSLEKFDCEGNTTSVSVRWEKWKRALTIYLEATDIQIDTKKRAHLLHLGVLKLQEIFYSIPGADIKASKDVDVFDIDIKKLDEYFSPKQSKVYERHIFWLLKQEPAEKFEEFLVRLRNQADKCKFASKEENLVDQITEKCVSMELRKRILQMGDDAILEKIIVEANALEIINRQLEEFSTTRNKLQEINKVDTSKQ